MAAVGIMILIITNSILSGIHSNAGREYKVEINRAVCAIEGGASNNLTDYKYIKAITKKENQDDFYKITNNEFAIVEVNSEIYRIDYSINSSDIHTTRKIMNTILAVMMAGVGFFLAVIFFKIILPFHRLSELPEEIAKGNLSMPLKAEKNKFFSNFVWGMDLLREEIEKKKISELAMQKEMKTLILSISHDIKTPLSAIRLYSKALQRNMYDEPEKVHEVAQRIDEKAVEIGDFTAQIIKASSEDILQLSCADSEFYLSSVMSGVTKFYTQKLNHLRIAFCVGSFNDCLLHGDSDRAVEVIQNVMENAIKYGDGDYIKISFESDGEFQLITIENSGCTLPDSELPNIFSSFWRGSNIGSNSGSGLGLFICRRLMQNMRGNIYSEKTGSILKIKLAFLRV